MRGYRGWYKGMLTMRLAIIVSFLLVLCGCSTGSEFVPLCDLNTETLVSSRGTAALSASVLSDPQHGSIVYDDRCPAAVFELAELGSGDAGVEEFLRAARGGLAPRHFRLSALARFLPPDETNDRPELSRPRIELLEMGTYERVE